MANHSNNRGHRRKVKIDFKELEKLCYMQCSEQEIAEWFHCSVDTIGRRVREQFSISFAEYFSKKRIGGLISLRRNQFKLSEKNAAMAIFLGKNYLGQADKQEIEHSGNISNKAEDMSDEELANIIASRRSRRATEEAPGS